jgi:hypothetical protein
MGSMGCRFIDLPANAVLDDKVNRLLPGQENLIADVLERHEWDSVTVDE